MLNKIFIHCYYYRYVIFLYRRERITFYFSIYVRIYVEIDNNVMGISEVKYYLLIIFFFLFIKNNMLLFYFTYVK